eukprot:SAG11_NODE_588_length_8329_cov_18.642857_8_plen_147_part_00
MQRGGAYFGGRAEVRSEVEAAAMAQRPAKIEWNDHDWALARAAAVRPDRFLGTRQCDQIGSWAAFQVEHFAHHSFCKMRSRRAGRWMIATASRSKCRCKTARSRHLSHCWSCSATARRLKRSSARSGAEPRGTSETVDGRGSFARS